MAVQAVDVDITDRHPRGGCEPPTKRTKPTDGVRFGEAKKPGPLLPHRVAPPRAIQRKGTDTFSLSSVPASCGTMPRAPPRARVDAPGFAPARPRSVAVSTRLATLRTLSRSVRRIDRLEHQGSTLTLCAAPTSIRLPRSARPPPLAVACAPPRPLPLAGSKRSFVASTNDVRQSEVRSVRRKSDPPPSSPVGRWALRPQDPTEAQRLESYVEASRETGVSKSLLKKKKPTWDLWTTFCREVWYVS